MVGLPVARMTRYDRRYARIAKSLSRLDLMRSSMDAEFGPELFRLDDRDASRHFLDFYGDEGLRLALERYGFFAKLESRGYRDFELVTRASDERHTLLVAGRPAPDAERVRLMELLVRREHMVPETAPGLPDLPGAFETLTVDWLVLRNPAGRFTPERPRLPGQDAPGLGIGEMVLALLLRVVERLELDVLVAVPEHFHNAKFYVPEMPFFDPWYLGQLRALEGALMVEEGLSLAQASWAIEWNHVRGPDGTRFRWQGHPMLAPRHPDLVAYLAHARYASEARRAADVCRYTLDRPAFQARWARERPRIVGMV